VRLPRRPPGLLIRTITVTFVTAAALLAVIFFAVMVSVRKQVRSTAQADLEASQRMFAAIQLREQRSMRLQATNVAESPTLKAAVDTYAAESRVGNEFVQRQLVNTIREELAKVADRVEADAIVVVDTAHTTLAASGPMAPAWPAGHSVPLLTDLLASTATDSVAHIGDVTFRVVSVPLVVSDGSTLGSLYLATSLDRRFAQQLGELAHAQIAIVTTGEVVASTLAPASEAIFESVVPTLTASGGTLDIHGESHAYRRLFVVGDTAFYALTSIDDAARAAVRDTTSALLLIAVGAMGLALLASIWIAHRLSEPIKRLSSSLHRMATSRQFDAKLPLTGSSRELDTLTETFNALMASVASAEAETEAAYTAAIRALATALDARDPYTAGHSERVSVLSVAIGRTLNLSADDLEVLRLGALLHDIGKIGVPDDVLRKPAALTPSEYDTIKQHTVRGARILRTVPFLSRHIPIVELHHERPDGNGYPHGLLGDDIPLAARIVHVADAYDAMTNARAYRPGRPSHEALSELWNASGTEFHAEVVSALASALPVVTTTVAAKEPLAEACVA
jgi:putative nucleotidyltransferase with HDIG domain